MLKKILVVDDDKFILFTVKELFSSEGFEVHTANSGKKCIEILEQGFKGVILMDIMMPEMDGWDTIREMIDKDLYSGNIVVMLTAMDVPDDKMEGLQEYITDYIVKPFHPGELLTNVNEYFSYL